MMTLVVDLLSAMLPVSDELDIVECWEGFPQKLNAWPRPRALEPTCVFSSLNAYVKILAAYMHM
ncbi:hypothetical protein PGT21_035907 [Puccinia graminis f. sp. tritici]|uniref:Uncharacterized protein n=1 Tax=Puccinia graminis f. sp. tritici TaxID=56615 RepID=A0A5B0RX58_PUCGR|nr:hypothetical protein PGT21_035907 [Puccinia graminis f. sp. tritici]KAA1130187.1 hypothetical protein PGTUg99_016524 [Puccinia graminis f. sp. tritici]